MSGNVYEWCWDWYVSISDSTAADGATSGDSRILRGGCFSVNGCKVASRSLTSPRNRTDYLGFRVVRASSK